MLYVHVALMFGRTSIGLIRSNRRWHNAADFTVYTEYVHIVIGALQIFLDGEWVSESLTPHNTICHVGGKWLMLVNICRDAGWGGGGLGQLEQGMVDPVQHAEVRDRTDLYKGIGISLNDPFENFRKSKSHGFVTRMREKAEAAAGNNGPPSEETTAD